MVTEADMERQLFQATSDVTVNKILMRYSRQRCSLPRSEAKPGAPEQCPESMRYIYCAFPLSLIAFFVEKLTQATGLRTKHHAPGA